MRELIAEGASTERWLKAFPSIKVETILRMRRYLINPKVVKPKETAPKSDLSSKLHKVLKASKGTTSSIIDLADRFDVAPKAIRDAVKEIEKGKVLVAQDADRVWLGEPAAGGNSTFEYEQLDIDNYIGSRIIRFGVVSDQHMCSRYERLDVLNAIYEVFRDEGIQVVYSPGNFIDGEARFNKNDLHTHGMGNQFRYFAKNYPSIPGLTTEFIGGDDHEGWYVQREGIDIKAMFDTYAEREGREDLKYLSYMEHDIIVPAPRGQTKIRLLHAGGGSAYAISYTTQKLIESLTGGEKPDIMLIGHYHKAEYIHYRGIHAIQAGTTQDQTPFMRKKRLSAHLGGWIVEAHLAEDGSVRRCKSEFINFYDKAYHKREWAYQLEAA